MSVDVSYSMYSKNGKYLYGFKDFDSALDFIRTHEVGYKWFYTTLFTREKITRTLPTIVCIVKEIDTGGGFSMFGKKYWFNVNKLKGNK